MEHVTMDITAQKCPHKHGIFWDNLVNYGYLKNVIASGKYHTIVISSKYEVKACGRDFEGQCKVEGWKDMVSVTCTDYATLGLSRDGTVSFTGEINNRKIEEWGESAIGGTPIEKWPHNIKKICSSHAHVVGLTELGTVVAFGQNEDGQCNVSDMCDICDICAYGNLTVCVRKDGTVVIRGFEQFRKMSSQEEEAFSRIESAVAQWTNIEHVYITPASYNIVCIYGLKYDGTVVVTDPDGMRQCAGWTNIVDVIVNSRPGEHAKVFIGMTGDGDLQCAYLTGFDDPFRFNAPKTRIRCISLTYPLVSLQSEDKPYVYQLNLFNGEIIELNSDVFESAYDARTIVYGAEVLYYMDRYQIFGTSTFFHAGDKHDYGQGKVIKWYVRNEDLCPVKGCYVATCVYGSYDCPEVWTLRRYRDKMLASTWYGRAFIHLYYAVSPTLVKWFGETAWFKNLWRGPLNHMVEKLQKEGYENTPYQDTRW